MLWALVLSLLLLLAMSFPAFAMMAGPGTEGMGDGEETPRGMRKRPKKTGGVRMPEKAKRPGGMGEEVFREHLESVAGFFAPIAGNVASASGSSITSDLRKSGLLKGMRFRVMRATEPFTHPVTGQKVLGTEYPVGMAEVASAYEGRGAGLLLIEGQARKGDILRISSAMVPVLFYQRADVDWDVSEEYYYWLEGTERYNLQDAPPGMSSDESLLLAAREAGADVVIVLMAANLPEGQSAGVAVRQRALWALDGKEFYSSNIVVGEEVLNKLKVAGEMFWPDQGKHILEVSIPFRAELMDTADLDCDGKDEVVFSSGSSLWVYTLDIELRPPFGLEKPLRIYASKSETNAWLEGGDIDGDGCDEILLNTIDKDGAPVSRIYKYADGIVRTLWSGKEFSRILEEGVYVQGYDTRGGYSGKVRPLVPPLHEAISDGDSRRGPAPLDLPEGVDIHDFAIVNSASGHRGIMAYDDDGHLVFYNGPSEVAWRSEQSYGGTLRNFVRDSGPLLPEDEQETWGVNDRIIPMGNSALVIFRQLRSRNMPDMGYMGSGVVHTLNPGPELFEDLIIDDIPRVAPSIAVSGGRLFVLRDSYSLNFLNMFRGKQLSVSKLLIYSLEGI